MSSAMAAHLSVVTSQTPSLAAAHMKVIHLYRDFQRGVPEIMRTHQLDVPMSQIRTKIREEFERHRDVKDLAVIDILLLKGRQEYQETLNAWKQETHIMRYFIKDEAPPKPEGFLEKFLSGRD
ncbi:hypothetical protein BGZ65_004763 [Modicella reniformis]|uniref:Complex 1 LYR protein domain-containing protein n=1 Tax=Modicella reniformis TaxID=1440133 RepID=A0A9P6LSD7_9FUNG|nr:hypothetical protein BGZ65_004763 [Modicella reniformis]